MGTSRTGAELAAKFDKVGKIVLSGNEDTVQRGARIVQTAALALAAPATGGDLKFSGTKNKKVGVQVRLVQGGVHAQAMAKATGPFHWLEGGVKPHAIVPKNAGGSRAARGAFVSQAFGSGTRSLSFGKKIGALKWGGDNYAKYVRRGGFFPELGIWTKAVDRAEPLYHKSTSANVVRQMSSVF